MDLISIHKRWTDLGFQHIYRNDICLERWLNRATFVKRLNVKYVGAQSSSLSVKFQISWVALG